MRILARAESRRTQKHEGVPMSLSLPVAPTAWESGFDTFSSTAKSCFICLNSDRLTFCLLSYKGTTKAECVCMTISCAKSKSMHTNCRWHSLGFDASFLEQKAELCALLALQHCSQFSEQRLLSQLFCLTHHSHGQGKQKCWDAARPCSHCFLPYFHGRLCQARSTVFLSVLAEVSQGSYSLTPNLRSVVLEPPPLADRCSLITSTERSRGTIRRFCWSNCCCNEPHKQERAKRSNSVWPYPIIDTPACCMCCNKIKVAKAYWQLDTMRASHGNKDWSL